MLELKPNCECCDVDLPANSKLAVMCTFECTFCSTCAADRFNHICPNCGGELVRRPVRPAVLLEKFPASKERFLKHHSACVSS